MDASTWAPTLEIVYGILAAALAVAVFALAPPRGERNILAALLWLEGISIGGIVAGIAHLRIYEGTAIESGLWGILSVALIARSFLYLAWLGQALDTPLTRPFATRAGQRVLAAMVFVIFLVYLFDGGVGAPRPWVRTGGPALYFLVGVYALFASTSAFQNTPKGTLAHTKARSYLVAFGIRDGAVFVLLPAFIINVATTGGVNTTAHVILAALQFAYLLFLFALGYGVLSGNFVSLDERLRNVLGAGLALSLVLAVATLAALAGSRTHVSLGVAAAALALVAGSAMWHPLDSGMARIAQALVPTEMEPQAPLHVRKQRFREHVEHMQRDGAISPRGEQTLENLRILLGMTKAQAADARHGFLRDLRTVRPPALTP